jgi:hypothetical protein
MGIPPAVPELDTGTASAPAIAVPIPYLKRF